MLKLGYKKNKNKRDHMKNNLMNNPIFKEGIFCMGQKPLQKSIFVV